jgi:hypothetical protein
MKTFYFRLSLIKKLKLKVKKNMDNILLNSYNLENIIFTKPKKYTEYLVSKVKYNQNEDFVIQFPKMTISDEPSEKNLELEFTSTKGYNKEMYNFLRNLDRFTVEKVQTSSQEWFEKEIPKESLKKMYNSFIKAPRTTESKACINFGIKTGKVKSLFLDKRGNDIEYSQFKQGEIVECIAQFKYILFSKDTCFPVWELVSSKLHKRIEKVPRFGFIDDPDDKEIVESDDEEITNLSFF